MNQPELLKRVKALLQAAFGDRLRGVVLYGSEARGQAGPDSDVDVLVLLAGPMDRRQDTWACIRALYPLVLELDGRPIHARPVDVVKYQAQETALYRAVRKEGIPA